MFKKTIYTLFLRLSRQAREYELKERLKEYGISDTVKLYNSDIYGNVWIGEFTYIGAHSILTSGENSSVVIGKHCAIGRGVSITSKGHDLRYPTSDKVHDIHKHVEKDTIIGDFVWIGDHVFIKHGINIGDYAVIGANSVVTKDVKPFEIVGGVPAKHIRFNTEHYQYPPIDK
jgi:acetyltransferase-like isoleucine patch superfamily enzyme